MLITESEPLRNIDVHAGNLIRGSGDVGIGRIGKENVHCILFHQKQFYFGENNRVDY